MTFVGLVERTRANRRKGRVSRIGSNGVSVPAYYCKVVVDLRSPGVEGIGFILPNGLANQSIGRYAVSNDSLEAFTGIDFVPIVADSIEEEIEGNISGEHWGLETGEKPITCKLDSWGKIRAE